MTKDQVTFLVVDDDDVAVMAIRRVVQKMCLINPIERAEDGREALDMLRGKDGRCVKRPYIILLDINMPRMNGLEFLAELREDIELANSVVFVMTTSDAPKDIAAAYANKIAGYIIKESAFDSLQKAMDMLHKYAQVVTFSDDSAGTFEVQRRV